MATYRQGLPTVLPHPLHGTPANRGWQPGSRPAPQTAGFLARILLQPLRSM